jgi:hypothetical protein
MTRKKEKNVAIELTNVDISMVVVQEGTFEFTVSLELDDQLDAEITKLVAIAGESAKMLRIIP